MGYNDDGLGGAMRRIVVDLETAPLADAAEYLDLSEIAAPANYRDPDKIAAYIEAEKAKVVNRAALDPDLCRIVALGWSELGSEAVTVVTCQTEAEERAALLAFWLDTQHAHYIGYNVLAFDFPVLFRRSVFLGITHPRLSIDRYRHADVTDLMRILDFNGAIKSRSLSFYCRRFGIVPTTPDPLTGADIGLAVAEARWDAVANHCRADVERTAALATRLGIV